MAIQDLFRLKNIFDNSGSGVTWPSFGGSRDVNLGEPPSSILMSSDPLSGRDPLSRMPDQDQEFPAVHAFVDSVLNPPERTKPSLARILGTGAMSALQGSGDEREPVYNTAGKVIGTKRRGFWSSLGNKPLSMEQAGEVLNAPYNQKVEDWKLRTGALKEAANVESQLPSRQAMARYREAQADILPQREGRLGREGEARISLSERRLDLENRKADLNEWKARNPNGRVMAVKGGNVIVVNPQTGETLDTGIPSGSLTDEERIRLTGQERLNQIGAQGAERLEQIGAQGQIRKEIQELGQQDALERIAASGAESRKTKETVPGRAPGTTAAGRPMSETQKRAGLQNRLNQLVLEAPEYADFVSIDPNTKAIVIQQPKDPNAWSWQNRGRPTQEQYDEIYEYIYGQPRSATPAKKVAAPVAPAPTAAPAETGKVIKQYSPSRNQTRISNDGGKTWKIVEGRQ